VIFGSVCSGIEAASVAWSPLGWRAAFLSEIDPFPRAVLQHHYPDVPLRGDFREINEGDHEAIDLLVGGTPCQSFSVAGLRGGMDDERGNLALEYLRLASRLRPSWLVWENVPGVLSSGGGRDFGSFLGALAELGYGWAYRVLDAQYVRVDGYPRAVPQRRRRVFVVGYLGNWRRAAAVLFEPPRSGGNPPTRRAGKQADAGVSSEGTARGGRACVAVSHDPAVTLCARDAKGPLPENSLSTVVVSCHAFDARQSDVCQFGPISGPLDTDPYSIGVHTAASAVRRLTPRECERLQGFPDDYTAIAWRGKPPDQCPDGPRYKALGNSMACNVVRWISRRIEEVERHV